MAKVTVFYETPNKFLKVPTEFVYHVIQNKQTNTLKFFLYLKFKSTYGYLNKPDFEQVAKELGVKERTVATYFKKLIELNWIGWDKKNNRIYLHGFTFICEQYGLHPYQSVIVYPFWIKNLKGYLLTIKIADVLKRRSRIDYKQFRKMYREKNLPDSNYRGSIQGFLPFLYKQHPYAHAMIPSTYLARNLKMSASTISKWKNLAVKTNNLKIQRNKAEFSKGSFAEYQVMRSDQSIVEKIPDFLLRRLQIDGDVISLRLPDSFDTKFTFLTKRTVN